MQYQLWLQRSSLVDGWGIFAADPYCKTNACYDPSRVMVASFMGHWLMFYLLAVIMKRFQFYCKFDRSTKLYWLSSIVSTVHSLFMLHATAVVFLTPGIFEVGWVACIADQKRKEKDKWRYTGGSIPRAYECTCPACLLLPPNLAV